MLQILYEDNHIIVCVKPRGILSQADISGKDDMLTILKAYIKEKYNKPGNVYLGLVHRLDINTRGIMVFAKTSKAASRLSKSINDKKFVKKYCAIVEGMLSNEEYITLHDYIKKDEKIKKSFINKDGQEAILDYRVIENINDNGIALSKIDITLHTGRFHQIRCQMANNGNPLYGDKKYGSKYNKEYYLNSYHLEFPHPTTGEILEFNIEY